MLLARARELLEDPAQGALDLAVEPSAPVASIVAAPADAALFDPSPMAAGARAGRGMVVGTHGRLLFDALAEVYAGLGFDAVGDAVFRDLAVARVVEPTSLLDVARVLTDLGRAPASYPTMRRTLARAQQRGYRDLVAKACFEHASTRGDISLVLYDVTTLYFEAEKEDGLRKTPDSYRRKVLQ